MIKKTKTKENDNFVSVKKYKALEKKANGLKDGNSVLQNEISKLRNIIEINKTFGCDCAEQKELLRRSNELKLAFLDICNKIKESLMQKNIELVELQTRIKQEENVVKVLRSELSKQIDEMTLQCNVYSTRIDYYELMISQFKSMSLFEFLRYKYAK